MTHYTGAGACAAHSLAEVYASMTRMPAPHRASAAEASQFVTSLLGRLHPVALTAREQVAAITDWAGRGIVGGAFYDALIASCALKAGARLIYTWNRSDFQRLGPEVASRLRTPGE